MRLDVANAKADTDAFDSEHALRHQHDAVAVRIDHRLRCRDAIARDQQLAIAGRRIVGQRLIDLVDLQDRAAEIVTVLLVAAADRLGVSNGRPISFCQNASAAGACWWQSRCRCGVWRVHLGLRWQEG
jgi:hypothetical protein